jgi:hypothetical protein
MLCMQGELVAGFKYAAHGAETKEVSAQSCLAVIRSVYAYVQSIKVKDASCSTR